MCSPKQGSSSITSNQRGCHLKVPRNMHTKYDYCTFCRSKTTGKVPKTDEKQDRQNNMPLIIQSRGTKCFQRVKCDTNHPLYVPVADQIPWPLTWTTPPVGWCDGQDWLTGNYGVQMAGYPLGHAAVSGYDQR